MKKALVVLIVAAMLASTLCACRPMAEPALPTDPTQTVTEEISEQPDVTPMQQVEYYENPVMSAKTENA